MPAPQIPIHYGYQTARGVEISSRGRDGGAFQREMVAGREFDPEMKPVPESREELMARIKQDQRPYWLQSSLDENVRGGLRDFETENRQGQLPPAQNTAKPSRSPSSGASFAELGNGVERPRSALHEGDFWGQQKTTTPPSSPPRSPHRDPFLDHCAPKPWSTRLAQTAQPATPAKLQVPSFGRRIPAQGRSRAASHTSIGPNFMYRPPTSPLALQPQNVDNETDDDFRARSRSPSKSSRRRTFSPGALRSLRARHAGHSVDLHTQTALSREEALPHQAHQPRRSISSLHSFSSPMTPPTRSRRGSFLSDGSPSGAPMVGGYEESILRGRMSTFPSRPLNFVASIGVLGKGDCKASLQCPSHIQVPFPAVFYDYGSPRTMARSAESGPSPYVGLIDLENRDHSSEGGGMHVDPTTPSILERPESHDTDTLTSPLSPATPTPGSGKRQRKIRTPASKTAPRGAYRIPQQGQLQFVIKNPNKTAVKLFLVPYDLQGMEPGQKTFIRQRSYSAGPIIDIPLTARKNLGTDRPEAALSSSENPQDRPVLRYLIHLHICCPSRGKFYLYKSIRVVFANRVPDGKERLRHETQLPQPRFITYKPEMTTSYSDDRDVRASRPSGFSLHDDVPSAATSIPSVQTRESRSSPGEGFVFPPRAPSMSIPEESHFVTESHSSDHMLLDDLEEALSPASSWKSLPRPKRSCRSPSFADGTMLEFKRTLPVSPEMLSEGSLSPRDSLLSMHLRDSASGGEKR